MEAINENISSPKINVRDATNAAISFLGEVTDKMGRELSNIRLEEVELSEDEKTWFITLGYDRLISREQSPFEPPSLSNFKTSTPLKREYKIFQINSQDGAVKSMKIRVV